MCYLEAEALWALMHINEIEYCQTRQSLLPATTKLGQGNIFTSVCQEFCPRGGGGVCLSACLDTPPSPGADIPPGSRHPPEQTPHQEHTPPGTDTPPEQTPPNQTPPRKQTAAYGQRAAGTHPTGMHSCLQ